MNETVEPKARTFHGQGGGATVGQGGTRSGRARQSGARRVVTDMGRSDAPGTRPFDFQNF